jgi:DNA helicase HerA-like ATPase
MNDRTKLATSRTLRQLRHFQLGLVFSTKAASALDPEYLTEFSREQSTAGIPIRNNS